MIRKLGEAEALQNEGKTVAEVARAHLLTIGWAVNRKRVQRLWREEGLRLPAKAKKRRRAGESTTEGELRAEYPGHV
ncbi:MAG TPA: IS3 family transposase [Polyangia bacterium]|nr:IS3 family transposase [Polyangia bacterium]